MPDAASLVLPGATLGILGGGQLGRMLGQAAVTMGYRCHMFSPREDCPAAATATRVVRAEFDDADALAEFAAGVDVVTLEWESVPTEAVAAIAERVAVRPGVDVLAVCQDRIVEKRFLEDHDLPVTPHQAVRVLDDLAERSGGVGDRVTFPAVLKTARGGYDGKGQRTVANADAARTAWRDLDSVPCLLEEFVDYETEISVVAARDGQGRITVHGPMVNDHVDGVLDVSVAPAEIRSDVAAAAVEVGRAVAESLQIVGIVCVEMFVTRDEQLLINELAPRPHNSGHWTIDGAITSQFEQHVRAVCGLPLGSTAVKRPAAMANLLGDLWNEGTPDWAAALAHDGVRLHLYDKDEPRPGRKMGHLTAVAETAAIARRQVLAARAALTAGRGKSEAD